MVLRGIAGRLGAERLRRSIVWSEVDECVNFAELGRIAPMTIEAEAVARPGLVGAPALPGRPDMLSHVAYITHDTSATVAFYTTLLGMDLVAAVMDDSIPSTGDPVPYFHSFFRMSDGSTIAFFEAPELPPPAGHTHPAYNIFQHIALSVDSPATVDAWHRWLISNGVEVVGPVDHKIIYSIYFYDPNGIRLELTTPIDPTWNNNPVAARESLREWEQVKATARETGQDMSVVLAELTRQRSHRKAE
jgi:catechol 2,3-dioxygenase-like lactoylglutathione lyase family enzyme